MRALDVLLTLGATLRLTRFVVTDDLGDLWVKEPVTKAVASRLDWRDPKKVQIAERYLDGLDCPFCVGYWVAVASTALTASTAPRSLAGRAWRFTAATLTLNYVAAHLGARLGDVEED